MYYTGSQNAIMQNVDVAMTASQKALGVPPGLAVLMVSQKAMSVLSSRK